MEINSPISLGELVDKITILEIKISKISDNNKLQNVQNELNKLREIMLNLKLENESIKNLKDQLFEINQKLWEVEDSLREKENEKKFDDEFINLARKVYALNDKRFEFKNELNKSFGSEIIEEKSYKKY